MSALAPLRTDGQDTRDAWTIILVPEHGGAERSVNSEDCVDLKRVEALTIEELADKVAAVTYQQRSVVQEILGIARAETQRAA